MTWLIAIVAAFLVTRGIGLLFFGGSLSFEVYALFTIWPVLAITFRWAIVAFWERREYKAMLRREHDGEVESHRSKDERKGLLSGRPVQITLACIVLAAIVLVVLRVSAEQPFVHFTDEPTVCNGLLEFRGETVNGAYLRASRNAEYIPFGVFRGDWEPVFGIVELGDTVKGPSRIASVYDVSSREFRVAVSWPPDELEKDAYTLSVWGIEERNPEGLQAQLEVVPIGGAKIAFCEDG